MTAHEQLREAIDGEQSRLRLGVPSDRPAAFLALLRVRERRLLLRESDSTPDLVTGRRLLDVGGNKALQLCFDAPGGDDTIRSAWPDDGLNGWAERFLEACDRLAEAELVLTHGETGFMRIVEDGSGTFVAWIATRRQPSSWRERADLDWRAAWLVRRRVSGPRAVRSDRSDAAFGDPESAADYCRLAAALTDMMAYQLEYPPDAVIGGCSVQTYRDVLGQLVAWALQARDLGEVVAARSEPAVVAALAATLAVDPAVVGAAVAAFTLDQAGAAYHAAVPGIVPAPLVRIGPGQLAWSVAGLTTEPFLFLTRELRRRDARDYHSTARLREEIFRQDLYALFGDRRFVTSIGRIELRRAAGDARTDIDAVVFDRKSGTLGLFELKSQDPFARSTAELPRRRDNFLAANRQISGVLDWLTRHGADTLLGRIDARTAKTFRAQKIYPFVLGRYLTHADDDTRLDRRVAWGTWPRVVRLVEERPFGANDANPLASLYARLQNDAHAALPVAEAPSREIPIGAARLMVYPSYAAFRASATDRNRSWRNMQDLPVDGDGRSA